MSDVTSTNHDPALARLTEMVLDHLGIPRTPSRHVQWLQDELLPTFMDAARHAWLAASSIPLPTGQPTNEIGTSVYRYLQVATTRPDQEPGSAAHKIAALNDILDEMGVHDLLGDVAGSPDLPALADIAVDPYEARLLRAAGHPDPRPALMAWLHGVAAAPKILSASEMQLEAAIRACVKANKDVTFIIDSGPRAAPQGPRADAPAPLGTAPPATAKPRRRRLFSSLGKLFSGLVLLSGNSIVIPTINIGSLTALPVLGSLAGGIAALGEAISQFPDEGE